MGTLLFVHGTGVRQHGFNQSFELIQHHAKSAVPAYTVRPCFWGQSLGAELHFKGASIPGYDATGGDPDPKPATDAEARLTVWRLLWNDPLFEFRVLSSQWKPKVGGTFGGLSELESLLTASLAGQGDAAPLAAQLNASNLTAEYATAVAWLAQRPEFLKATGDSRAPEVAARALVAKVAELSGATHPDSFAPLRTSPKFRDSLERMITAAITPKTYAIFGAFMAPVAALGTLYVRRNRGEFSDGTSPAAGDILVYQARGSAIRKFIRDRLREASGPVVILAHSLGGIAAVETLIEGEDGLGPSTSKVSHLVTVGSQAPYFYEIGALATLPLSAKPADTDVESRLPDHFPKRWLNFYDLRDFLSYQGHPIFGKRVTDVKVDNGLAFPESHSAYWANGDVWDGIRNALA